MSKYIEAYKLKAEIKWKIAEIEKEPAPADRETILLQMCKINAFREVLSVINRIETLQQEQPEVELEEEMDKFYGVYRDKTGKTYDIEDDEPCFDWKEGQFSESDMRIARHFYELGLKARKEE